MVRQGGTQVKTKEKAMGFVCMLAFLQIHWE